MSIKYGLLVVVLLTSLILAACGDDDQSGPKELYDGGISLDLPSGWDAETDDIGRKAGRFVLYWF